MVVARILHTQIYVDTNMKMKMQHFKDGTHTQISSALEYMEW